MRVEPGRTTSMKVAGITFESLGAVEGRRRAILIFDEASKFDPAVMTAERFR